ncbi:hypothetical protein [Haloarcula marina]|uniref:hypothetical protein n=1 Tax=Haloarcula marina TaxID=2961574 RepID=UPI0020B64A59|nr:hypothetical protein [Halomicroarcula marina]
MKAARTHAGLLLLSALIVAGTTGIGLFPMMGAAQSVDDGTLVVESTTADAEFTYTFTVNGTVAPADDARFTSEDSDHITDNGDGTVTVTGYAGDQSGDAYVIDGRITNFEKTGGESEYRLLIDGENVTHTFVARGRQTL